ncbi:putative uncharacterized protein [Clostridium sp. CAG:167]|nr:putative uncharacterized protein [Clostridium sp. CAG:167]
MDGMLSQEEINALLGSMSDDDNSQSADETETVTDVPEAAEPVAASVSSDDKLSPEEADALGEVANISMGTAATTLSVLNIVCARQQPSGYYNTDCVIYNFGRFSK